MSYPIKCLTNIAKYDPNFLTLKSTIKLFADDTSLYLIIDNPQTMADILNRGLDKIHTWSTNWLVSFNPQKTETMTISRKINKPHYPDIFMNDTYIAEVPNHKHLRLNISKDGTHHRMKPTSSLTKYEFDLGPYLECLPSFVDCQ
jgi:hypothetical protein